MSAQDRATEALLPAFRLCAAEAAMLDTVTHDDEEAHDRAHDRYVQARMTAHVAACAVVLATGMDLTAWAEALAEEVQAGDGTDTGLLELLRWVDGEAAERELEHLMGAE